MLTNLVDRDFTKFKRVSSYLDFVKGKRLVDVAGLVAGDYNRSTIWRMQNEVESGRRFIDVYQDLENNGELVLVEYKILDGDMKLKASLRKKKNEESKND
ncbi:hypothetical protein A134_23190 [Vibrio crassostreae 9CS106]|uniref:Uncharacterized protein n=1 Tax=Vibrio crassostreae 9CS106 TaxID=1191300 RepID=A0A1B1C3G0_9VIBR|nr:hypothetical protein A134_23190 [Vibrio crassostreae 9CS106]